MIITIEVVRLSRTADMKKVMIETITSKRLLSRAVTRRVMKLKPPWASINSTIVIAPIRKINVVLISPTLFRIW